MEYITTALQNDDTEEFFNEAPDGFYILPPKSFLPDLLKYKPNLPALTAYFGAIKCFTALINMPDQNEINCDTEGRDCIHFAASQNRSDFVRLMCEVYNQQNNEDNNRWTPLHYAAAYDAPDCVDVLLEFGVNVNAKDSDGMSPLHLAKSETVAEKLINNGARVNARSADGATPLLLSAKRGDSSMVQFLLSQGANINHRTRLGWNCFHFAAQSGNARTMKTLFKSTPNRKMLSETDRDGRTSLHYAAEAGDPQTVVFLLKHAVDPNIQDNDGMAAIHFAASEGNVVAIRALINRGADSNLTDKVGRNCLHFAAMSGNSEAIELFSSVLSAQSGTAQGTLPIHIAAEYDRAEAIDILSQKSDVNSPNAYGKTPLCVAAEFGSSKAIQTLLKNGAQTDMIDKSGLKPIDRAIIMNCEEATELLSDAGSVPSPIWKKKKLQSFSLSQQSPMSSPKLFSRLSQHTSSIFY